MHPGLRTRPATARGRARRAVAATALLGALAPAGACVPGAPGDAGGADGPTGPGADRSVRLAWVAPSTDAEGGPLSDLAGFRVHFAPGDDAEGPGAGTLEVGPVTTAVIPDLAPGTWTFAVAAVDTAGNESALSAPLTATVGVP